MIVLIRGGGDLASGVALRLYKAGVRVVVTELPQPLAVRRLVSFSEAVYAGDCSVEGVAARRVTDPLDTLRILQVLSKGHIPVLIDPEGVSIKQLHPHVVVEARMTKQRVPLIESPVKLIIGLGPGFVAGENCHAAIETNRGHMLGRVIWNGAPEPDTREPDAVVSHRNERVLRAPATGELVTHAEICDHLEAGQLVAEVDGQPVHTRFTGVLRGLLRPGVRVVPGLKIGDVDPRNDSRFCTLVSDKSLAIAGGVLEAILSRTELRTQLWT
jgi:xanthine dehydrogenase accessory factor